MSFKVNESRDRLMSVPFSSSSFFNSGCYPASVNTALLYVSTSSDLLVEEAPRLVNEASYLVLILC